MTAVDVMSGPWETRPALLAAIDESPLPVAVLELPAGVILAMSSCALEIIDRDRSVIGRLVDDITVDAATGGFALLHQGRLSGYETTRVFAGASGERTARVWLRALAGGPTAGLALVVFAGPGPLRAALHLLDGDATGAPVIGTADRTLAIDRISAEVEELLGAPAADVLHQPILRLVVEEDSAALLLALAEAAATGNGACVAVRLHRASGGPVPVFVSLVPLAPAPSFAFAITDRTAAHDPRSSAAASMLMSIGAAIEGTDTTRGLAKQSWPVKGLERLTNRELHIVGRLVDGDRVPAIAASLFLSQSTVRNHLSSVFAKLGVSTQQELIHLLRRRSDGSSTD